MEHEDQTTQAKAVSLADLQHRVRNTLALMRTLIRRSAETSESLEEYVAHLDGRLDAVGRVQNAIIRDPVAGIDLTMLILDELTASGAQEGERVRIEGSPILLHPRAAETIGLALHELTTNAVKFGALSQASGRIGVTWAIEEQRDGPHLHLDWIETGVTARDTAPTHSGFGWVVLQEMLAFNLKAQTALLMTPEGLTCRIDLPATDRLLAKPSQSPAR